ncbi:ABC transporter permease [Streptomyces massasporeus]|uniref:ABC transporter permease n=1 Tax=Streptomyces massasporeus TaxID=67324 RepID=UPI0036B7099C
MTQLVESAVVSATASAEGTPQPVCNRRFKRRWGWLIGLPLPVVIVALWHVGVKLEWHLPFGIQMGYLPLPWDVARRIVDLSAGGVYDDTFSGTLPEHLWTSLKRVVSGFGLALVLAVPLGVVAGRFTTAYKIVDPTINIVRPIPVTAWAPLALVIIGFGDRATIFLIFIAAYFPILINTVSAVKQVPPRLGEAAAMLGTSRRMALMKVSIPAAAPGILAGVRIGLGLAWVVLVVGETVGISTGLGAMITQARDQSKTDLVVAGMLVIGLAGFLTDRLLVGALKLALRGRPLFT